MGVVLNPPVMKQIIFAAALFVVSLSQDTNYCPDGWYVSDFDDKIECIYFGSQTEQVTKTDASVLCAARGGWLVDMDEGRGPAKNNFLKSLLSEHVGQGDPWRPGMQWDYQWWIGAECNGAHSEHNWGNWTWDHTANEIEWYDWMRDEPNDWRSQDCLTFLKDQDIFGYGVWHWNDWSCDRTAGYICERDGNVDNGNEEETTVVY